MNRTQNSKKLLSPKAGALCVRWGNSPAPPTLEAANSSSLSVLSYSPTSKAKYEKEIPNIQTLLLFLEGKGWKPATLKLR